EEHGGFGKTEPCSRRDDEHSGGAVRRPRVGARVLELATEVESAEEAEDLAERRSRRSAERARQIEASARVEEQARTPPSARGGGEEKYPAFHPCRHSRRAGSVWRVRAYSFQGSRRNDARRRGRFETVKWSERSRGPSSSHASGVETGAPGRARVE